LKANENEGWSLISSRSNGPPHQILIAPIINDNYLGVLEHTQYTPKDQSSIIKQTKVPSIFESPAPATSLQTSYFVSLRLR
jgi:hypothetical protein